MEFVITSETNIAKGVRRLTALSRHLALEALGTTTTLEQEMDQLEALGVNGDSKTVRSFKTKIDDSMIPLVAKSALLSRVQLLTEKLFAYSKQLTVVKEQAMLKEVQSEVARQSTDAIVIRVSSFESSLIKPALSECKRLAPTQPALVFGVIGDELVCGAYVPESWVTRGLRADGWVQAVVVTKGGKAGGQATTAQGRATGVVGGCEELIDVARGAVSGKW